MMKKLMVLALVLGIGSMAAAGFDLQLNADNGLQADFVGDGADVSAAFYISAIDGLVDGTLHYDGSLSSLEPADQFIVDIISDDVLGQESQVFELTLADGAGTPLSTEGLMASFTGTAGTTVSYHDADTGAVMGQVTLVPEPMTLGLLGIGGLFLRRRK